MSLRLHNRPAERERAKLPMAAGGYLTDGTRLFRCLETHDGGVVLLEDCASFECVHLYFDEVADGMRLVKPAS